MLSHAHDKLANVWIFMHDNDPKRECYFAKIIDLCTAIKKEWAKIPMKYYRLSGLWTSALPRFFSVCDKILNFELVYLLIFSLFKFLFKNLHFKSVSRFFPPKKLKGTEKFKMVTLRKLLSSKKHILF